MPARPLPPTPDSARIQKILSEAGYASRREAEEWIREGRVTVNGKVAVLGEKADPHRDAIKLDGRRIRPPAGARRYVLLNKPRGFVTTVSDPRSRDTVLDLLPEGLRRGLKPVGRLDVQTEGLLLLTDDGELARRVTHPTSGCPKLYRVKVSGVPAEKDLERLRRGIFLDGSRTRPCEIRRVSTTGGRDRGNSWLEVTLREGRSRQIRRMFEVIGHPVSKLRRVAIGPVTDRGLAVGAWRRLEAGEVEGLRKAGQGAGGAGKPPQTRERP